MLKALYPTQGSHIIIYRIKYQYTYLYYHLDLVVDILTQVTIQNFLLSFLAINDNKANTYYHFRSMSKKKGKGLLDVDKHGLRNLRVQAIINK